MPLEFGLTEDHFNSKYAPLAALAVTYRRRQVLKPLGNLAIAMKKR